MQKSETNEDLRVQRTRKLLQQALMELTVEKGFAAVTVRDITERARVNRSTFYRHYLDKYDLLRHYMDDIHDLVSNETFVDEKVVQSPEFAPKGLVSLLEHVQMFADFYRVMLGQNGDPEFTERFRQNSEKRMRFLLSQVEEPPPDPNAPPLDLQLNYISCAGVGAILWWLENDQPCSVEEMAHWISQLSTKAVGLPTKRRTKTG